MSIFSTNLTKSLCVMTLGFGLFACGGDKPAETTNAQPASAEPVATTGGKVITVAVSPYFAPHLFLDDVGNVAGFDVDLMNTIAKNKGFTVEYKPTSDFGQIFQEVEGKTADVAMSAILQTEDRASKYALTQPYGSDSLVYFYRADNGKVTSLNPSTLSDLSGKGLTLTGTAGTQQMEYIESVNSVAGVVSTKTDFLAFTNVLQQKADVGFTDNSILNHFVKNSLKDEPIEFKSVAYQGQPTNYVMVLNKENAELLETLNAGISELVQSGEIKALEDKWFK